MTAQPKPLMILLWRDDRIHRNPERLPELSGAPAPAGYRMTSARKEGLIDPCRQVAMAHSKAPTP